MLTVAFSRGKSLPGADFLFAAGVVAWAAWVLTSRWWSGRAVTLTSPYLIAPLVLSAGVVLGRVFAPRSRRWRVLELLTGGALALLLVPLYTNAKAAVGIQIVALFTLLLSTESQRAAPGRPGRWTVTLATGGGVIGVLLSSGSDAASILMVLLTVGSAWVIGSRRAPTMQHMLGIAALIQVWAALVVVLLGSLDTWPDRLNSNASLSAVRHILWFDALALWRASPVTGAGPGSFTEYSELASSSPSLAAVHSSVLQVGSELGLIGVSLFACMVAGGLVMLARGARTAGLIAAAAWTCLGVHAFIDHLWEFPVVMLTAGSVLGWASSSTPEQCAQGTAGARSSSGLLALPHVRGQGESGSSYLRWVKMRHTGGIMNRPGFSWRLG